MKKLSESAMFSKLVSNNKLLATMKMITSSNIEPLAENDLLNEFSTINRRINYTSKGAIMDLFSKKRIVLINNPDYIMPSYITTIPAMGANGTVIYINLNKYSNKSGEILPKTLFALMQNALISIEFMENWNKYVTNIEIVKYASLTYSRMVTKILDKIFALDLDPFKSDFMSYVFSKFFLKYMCDRTNEELNCTIAYKSCFNQSSLDLIKDFESELPTTMYDNIFSLFDALKLVNGFSSLNFRSFLENYLRMYGEASLLSLDYLPSFFQTIFSSTVGGNICKDYMIESVAGKFSIKVFNAFSKTL